MKLNFDEKELTSEKSLWDIYVLSRKIKLSKFSEIFMSLSIMLISIRSLFVDSSILLNEVRKWSEIGFNSSISTLGFLITGFAIFATLTKPKMFLILMDHKHKKTDLPYLKYNLFCFVKVFIYYIFFTFLYLSVILFGGKDGLFENFIVVISFDEIFPLKDFLIKAINTIIASSMLLLLLQLKTFIFNIYSIVMNNLRWEYRQCLLEEKEKNNPT